MLLTADAGRLDAVPPEGERAPPPCREGVWRVAEKYKKTVRKYLDIRIYPCYNTVTSQTKGDDFVKAGDAVREVMKLNEIGVNQLADKMGKSPRLVSERLAQENISVKKLNEMLRIMGYKTVIVPRGTRPPADSFEIE